MFEMILLLARVLVIHVRLLENARQEHGQQQDLNSTAQHSWLRGTVAGRTSVCDRRTFPVLHSTCS